MNNSPYRIISLVPGATYPPKMGGQIITDALNRELSNIGCIVEQYSMGIRKTDLLSIGRVKKYKHSECYYEYRRTEPITLLIFSLFSSINLGFFPAGDFLNILKWRELSNSIAKADAIIFESPWCFHPSLVKFYNNGPIFHLSQNAEYFLSELTTKNYIFGQKIKNYIEKKEGEVIRNSHITFAISLEDRIKLIEKYEISPKKIKVLPRGIDINKYKIISDLEKDEIKNSQGFENKIIAIFVGSNHKPNYSAVKYLEEISNSLRDSILIIVTGSIANEFKGKNSAKIKFIPGNPNSLLQISDIALNPITQGSGMNIKMLEYFCYQLPTISTCEGARGITGIPGEDFIICELGDFLPLLLKLSDDPQLRKYIGSNARQLVEEKYSARLTAQELIDQIIDWKETNNHSVTTNENYTLS